MDGDTLLTGDPELNSNPYDLVRATNGDILVTDSGANAVLRVNATTKAITPFAIFPARENPLFAGGNGIGGPFMDQVPTGITVGPDGAYYVATLTGFPFPTGGALVYRLADGNADGDALDDGESTIFVSGLTTATDLVFDGNGDLLITQFSTNMLASAPGRISRVSDGQTRTIVHLLVTPTSLTVSSTGRLIVSQEFAGMVSDVTDVLPGGFGATIVPGVNLSSYGGGPVAQIAAELGAAGATSLVVTVDGSFVIYIVGAPGFVNTAFTTAFPDGLPAGAGVLVIVTN
ncbi:MAG: ScyD/ScyE family protein [Chloroflexi bacterium]|nr:ScyD/ScyE family protein [Chloroflexota bacterium]MDA1145616.1 ScyD/ScyE family protein [Chloroflexota bacterium]